MSEIGTSLPSATSAIGRLAGQSGSMQRRPTAALPNPQAGATLPRSYPTQHRDDLPVDDL